VEPLESIRDDSVGVSETQRKFLNISKIEEIQIKLANITELNGLATVECELECAWLGNP
jgi:hypothetical protein